MITERTKVINRLKRIEGQVRGVITMVEDGKDCKDVVTQLSAIRGAMEKTIGYTVANNLENCIYDKLNNGKSAETVIKDAVDLVAKNLY